MKILQLITKIMLSPSPKATQMKLMMTAAAKVITPTTTLPIL